MCRYFLQPNLDMSMMEICITLSAVPTVELNWQKQLEVINKFLESEGLWGNHTTTETKFIHLTIPKTHLRDNLKISWVGNSMTFLELRKFSHYLNMKYPWHHLRYLSLCRPLLCLSIRLFCYSFFFHISNVPFLRRNTTFSRSSSTDFPHILLARLCPTLCLTQSPARELDKVCSLGPSWGSYPWIYPHIGWIN